MPSSPYPPEPPCDSHPGTGLTVQQGALNANGTPLDPIVFTSANEQPGLTAAPGDWNGIVLGNGAGGSVLRNVFVKYGAGLALTNCSPTVDAFTALFNAPAGLTVAGSAVLNTASALAGGERCWRASARGGSVDDCQFRASKTTAPTPWLMRASTCRPTRIGGAAQSRGH